MLEGRKVSFKKPKSSGNVIAGRFLAFGVDYVVTDHAAASYSVAICEDGEGDLHMVDLDDIKFMDGPHL